MMRLRDTGQNVVANSTSAQREPWNKCEAILFAVIDDVFPFTVEDAVAVLNGDNLRNFACPLNVLTGDIGESDQVNFAFCLQLGESLDRCVEGNCGIRRVQLIEFDAIQAKALEAPCDCFT